MQDTPSWINSLPLVLTLDNRQFFSCQYIVLFGQVCVRPAWWAISQLNWFCCNRHPWGKRWNDKKGKESCVAHVCQAEGYSLWPGSTLQLGLKMMMTSRLRRGAVWNEAKVIRVVCLMTHSEPSRPVPKLKETKGGPQVYVEAVWVSCLSDSELMLRITN